MGNIILSIEITYPWISIVLRTYNTINSCYHIIMNFIMIHSPNYMYFDILYLVMREKRTLKVLLSYLVRKFFRTNE